MILNMASQLDEYLSSSRQNKESIHSGQFMVSHFEEVQDEDDNGIAMPDPDETDQTNITHINEPNLCQQVQLYVPKTKNECGSSLLASHLEIETSLTKLFKCMNLAYSQKLTSPKWNHFKGVRLRWKDKIRLNNVIWRCWHMQFILKRKTPVCQFASPLDVDVHNNPQSVVLEGKYWKRQLDVIKAEYRKWRRNFKSNAIGYLPYDTISELDFVELSSLPDDRCFFQDEFYSDTLFSSIIEPFPFPDRREIARSANNADLLQPNLGALQPNLDDIDITFQELLQNTRLPSVPEEASDDILKGVEYSFGAIMGTEQMDTSNIIDSSNSSVLKNSFGDSNIVELNTPTIQENLNSNLINNTEFSNQILNQSGGTLTMENINNIIPINTFPILNNIQIECQINAQQSGFPSKNLVKNRNSKTLARSFRRREPHNYDKAQPTLHQTNIYQQMLAEQQQQQQQRIGNILQYSQDSLPNANSILQNTEHLNKSSVNMLKSFSVPQTVPVKFGKQEQKLDSSQSEILNLLNFNTNLNQYQNNFDGNLQEITTSNKTFTNLKQSSTGSGYIDLQSNINQNSLLTDRQENLNNFQFEIDFKNIIATGLLSQPIDTPKEMIRSNSLPLNSSLKKQELRDENFAVPKYHVKNNRSSRTRSNSVQQNQVLSYMQMAAKAQLQSATSEPALNSTLAQLLTTNNQKKIATKYSSSTSAIPCSLPPSGFSLTTIPAVNNNNNINNNNNKLLQNLPKQAQHLNITTTPIKSSSLPQNLLVQRTPVAKQVSFPSPYHSNQNLNLSPESFTSDVDNAPRSPSFSSSTKYPRENQRRAGHIHAEQKRRYNIKNGFDMLHSLIPQLQQNPNSKLSKAAMLQKGADHIKQLRSERNALNEKMDALRKERDNLNNSLSHLHSILPANGAPVSRQRTERVRQLYNQYVRFGTMQNWKFWILGLILEPLLNSYTTTVSTASIEELHRTALHWVDQHCSLIELRPGVSNKLRYLSMTTDILSDPPSTLKEEVIKAVNNHSGEHPNLENS